MAKFRVGIDAEGTPTLYMTEGTFEESKVLLPRLADELSASTGVAFSYGEVEQHRHGEDEQHVHLQEYAGGGA